jgi:flavin reductase (DIM6/NTAB) family NADH-FMN oxidoreductase RutF
MDIDAKQFLDAIGSFVTGVSVITTGSGNQVHGMTATAVTSVSLQPMLIAVGVAKKARMAETLKPGSFYTVNILREDQAAISNHFAGAIKTSERADKIRFVPWEQGSRLEGCLAALYCETAEILDGGDHWLVIGRVHHAHGGQEPRKPLLYFRGKYGRLEPGGSLAPSRDDFDDGTPQIFYDW